MRIVSNKAPRGIALIIVMISIFVLTVLAGAFAVSMKVETRLARNADNQARLEWMGRSAVEYACWVRSLSRNPQEPYDSLDQPWATGSGLLGPTNAPVAEVEDPLQFSIISSPYGTATWHMTDLESKININTANYDTLQQAFMAMGVDAGALTPLCNSILDWKDNNKDPRIQGAKSDYYQGLEPPYVAKNAPIDDISELLLVKGITENPELYSGGFSTANRPGTFRGKQGDFGGPGQGSSFGLVDVFTPISHGTVNWRTASLPVLQAMGLDPVMAQDLIRARSAVGEYGQPGPMNLQQALGLPPNSPQLQMILPKFDQQGVSYTFQVSVDAAIGSEHRYFNAIIGQNFPNAKDVQILSFYWTDTKPSQPSPNANLDAAP